MQNCCWDYLPTRSRSNSDEQRASIKMQRKVGGCPRIQNQGTCPPTHLQERNPPEHQVQDTEEVTAWCPTWKWVLDALWAHFKQLLGLIKPNFESFVIKELILRRQINFSQSAQGFGLEKRKKLFSSCEGGHALRLEIDRIAFFIESSSKVIFSSRSTPFHIVFGFFTLFREVC